MPDDSASDPALSPPTPPRGLGSLLRTGSLIALVNLISRLLSFAGDTVKSHYFGAGGRVDAFNVSAAVPTLLNDLLITSLVNSAYIPVLSSYDEAERRRLAAALFNLTFLVFSVVVVLLEALAPQLVALVSGGSPADVQALTVSLLHTTLPALLLFNISGILGALLYSHHRLLLPTIAGAVFNGAILVAALGLQARFGIAAPALGLLVGTVLQVAVQGYGLWYGVLRSSRRVPHDWLTLWHPGLRRIAVLFLPILAGLLVEILISRPVTFALASQTGEGGISWMNYALTLRQLPEGLIAAALSVLVLVRLSSAGSLEIFRSILAQGLQLAILVILPATVGLFLLARPVTALLYQHGDFRAFDTQVTADALRWYLLGLPFSVVDLLLVVAFYARHNTRTPALIGVVCTAAYIVLAEVLLPRFGLNSIMIADSFKFALHTVISALLLFLLIGGAAGLGLRRLLRDAVVASAVMGLAVAALSLELPSGDTLIAKLIAVAVPVSGGVLIYGGVLALLRREEVRRLVTVLRTRRSIES